MNTSPCLRNRFRVKLLVLKLFFFFTANTRAVGVWSPGGKGTLDPCFPAESLDRPNSKRTLSYKYTVFDSNLGQRASLMTPPFPLPSHPLLAAAPSPGSMPPVLLINVPGGGCFYPFDKIAPPLPHPSLLAVVSRERRAVPRLYCWFGWREFLPLLTKPPLPLRVRLLLLSLKNLRLYRGYSYPNTFEVVFQYSISTWCSITNVIIVHDTTY